MRFPAALQLILLSLWALQAHALDVCSGKLTARTIGAEFHKNLERVCVKVADTIVVTYEVREGDKLVRKELEGTKTQLKSKIPHQVVLQNVREIKDKEFVSETLTLFLLEKNRIRHEGAMAEFYEGNVLWARKRKDGTLDSRALKQLHYYAESPKPLHWSYSGKTGPKLWGELSGDFELCESGSVQSPIALETAKAKGFTGELKIESARSALSLVNNGHTLQANVSGENYLLYGGKKYKLLQFHIHTPSEHQLDGKVHDMEIHFVHENADKSFAVLGVFVDAAKENPKSELAQSILDHFPREWNKPVEFSETIVPSRLLPKKRAFFHYPGSLTTPPCSEGISWFVVKEPLQMSSAQLAQVKEIVGGTNARRPLAETAGRVVYQNDKPVLEK